MVKLTHYPRVMCKRNVRQAEKWIKCHLWGGFAILHWLLGISRLPCAPVKFFTIFYSRQSSQGNFCARERDATSELIQPPFGVHRDADFLLRAAATASASCISRSRSCWWPLRWCFPNAARATFASPTEFSKAKHAACRPSSDESGPLNNSMRVPTIS